MISEFEGREKKVRMQGDREKGETEREESTNERQCETSIKNINKNGFRPAASRLQGLAFKRVFLVL